MDWLTETKIPIGKWAAAVFDWLQANGAWFFDGLSDGMEWLVERARGWWTRRSQVRESENNPRPSD